MKIAFLGMGLMGAPMALNCLKAGHQVTVWNRTTSKTGPLREAGAQVAENPAEAARGKEAVLFCVDDHHAVESLIFGPEGIYVGLKQDGATQSNTVVIDHSTISPFMEAAYARRLHELTGAQLIDAPVTGGDAGARAATLSILVGGPASAFQRAEPLFAAMGKTITHIGEKVGDGQKAKLINQVLVAINLMAVTDALRLGEGLGLEMQRVHAAISGGAAGSWSLSNLGPKWLARDFAPGFRLRHLLKDLRYARELIDDDVAQYFPALNLALRLFERADAAGLGDNGTQAMGMILEQKETVE